MDVRTKSVQGLLLLAALGLWSACISKPPDGRLKCTGDSDCPSGWHCRVDSRCYTRALPLAADSGTSSSKTDATTPAETSKLLDASAPDAAFTDAMQSMPSGSAGGTSGSESSAGGGGSSGSAAPDAGGSGAHDAGEPPVPVQMVALGANGCALSNTLCERSAECVSDRCLITTCEAPGTFCDGPAECCDLACNGGLCKCGNHSASCSTATTPCCSGLYCETGQCATCKAQGASCAGAYQCCGSTDCYAGLCQCRPTGASCDSQSVCCAGTRCDGGQCKCRAEGMACDSNSVCCSGLACSGGMCAVPPIGPIRPPGIFIPGGILTFACLATPVGQNCTNSSDCCSRNCFDGKCVEACRRVGDEADVDSQCCSRLRANGKCAYAACYMTGHACTANQNCCSGRCVSSQCSAP